MSYQQRWKIETVLIIPHGEKYEAFHLSDTIYINSNVCARYTCYSIRKSSRGTTLLTVIHLISKCHTALIDLLYLLISIFISQFIF